MSGVNYHAWTHRPKAQGGTDPIESASGLPFCSAITSNVSVTGSSDSFNIADFSSGTTFKTNDSSIFPSVYHDTGKTPAYGIQVPANYLVQVQTSLWLAGDVANGKHSIGWIIDGSYSVPVFSPISAEFYPEASSVIGLADDHTAPRALELTSYLGDNAVWVVGAIHQWYSWTTDPLYFKYAISVMVVGDLPV